jgi:hypothetical protein
MNTVLLISTLVSVAVAAGLAIVLIGMRREERRRADARVQLLSGLASRQRSTAPSASASARAVPALEDTELRPSARGLAIQDLFHERQEQSAWPHRFAVIGVLVVLVGITALGFRQMGGSNGTARDAATRSATPADSEAPPLELVTMHHANEDGSFTISGTVRNPRGGPMLKAVNATVLVFGPGGSFVTNMRAPLDYTTLAPGEESPFVIRLRLTSAIERYRIGFRTEDGRVLSHVDRRAPDSIAQKQVP